MGNQSIHEAGGKIIAIAEADGGLIDESMKGLDISALKAHHMKKGTITGFPGAQTVCDLLNNFQDDLKHSSESSLHLLLDQADSPALAR